MKEKDLQELVVQLAKLQGWRIHHVRAGMNRSGHWSTAIQGHGGFPDLVLARGPELLFVELKSREGRLGHGQPEWHEALRATGAVVLVLRPADWIDGTIQELLRRQQGS